MLILVRHGRSEANAAGLASGRLDVALDDVGREQARAAGAALGTVPLVVTSPLTRARDTAACIDGPVRVDDRWAELDYGEWEGKRLTDIPASVWEAWRHDLDFRPPGGETLRELGARVRASITELVTHEGDVVVVSHVAPIKIAVAWALGVADDVVWRTWVAPASISRIKLDDPPLLVGFNDVSHVAEP